MPVGMITNVLALFIGGLLGGFLGKKISPELKTSLNNIFGFCAMAIGVTLIVKLSALSAVVLAVVLGTLLGEVLKLESRVDGLVCKAAPKLLKGKQVDEAFVNTFCAVAIIFCCSGTGWYGALTEGFTGDGSILLTKSILDFFTALIFAAVQGNMVAWLAAPQLAVYIVLFAVSRLMVPLVTDTMLGDFSAVGGVLELATGMRIAGIKKDTKVINIVPAMILVFPISALWKRLVG